MYRALGLGLLGVLSRGGRAKSLGANVTREKRYELGLGGFWGI